MSNRNARLLVCAPLLLMALATTAEAVSDQVRMSCREDYYAHCPNHALGSSNLRKCMKTAGPKLSPGCIKALVASGEITQAEIRDISRRLKAAQ